MDKNIRWFKLNQAITQAGALVISALLALPSAQAQSVCNPLSLNTCGLPFPSDYWTVQDASSPTGTRIQTSDELIRPELLAQLPVENGISVEQIFNGASGFSAASAVVFEFAQRPDDSALDKYGADMVMAYDLTSGNFVDIRTQISNYARGRQVSAPSEVLEVYPLDRWSFGHTIAVVVTKALPIDGEEEDFLSLQNNATSPEQQAYLTQLSQAIGQMGLQSDQIRNATLFTVRDRAEVLDPMRTLVERTFAAEHPLRNVTVNYKGYFSKRAAVITGELLTHNYRRENGIGLVDFDGDYQEQWIPFRLSLPKAARNQGSVPVAFYAHGLGLSKESDLLVADQNASLGVATFSVDFPNHGARSKADGGMVFTNLTISKVTREIGMMTQNNIDFAAAHKALIGMADLDVVGKWRWGGCWQCADGIPDLDTGRVFMQGTSLGGVLGSAYAALSPDLDGAVFHVSGVGVTSILAGSILWDVAFSHLEPPAATGAEALLLKGAIQQMLDYGDSINYIDLMRNPDNGRPIRPLFVITGAGDNIVPNDSSVAMARLAGLPIVGPLRYDIPGVEQRESADELGFGLTQQPPLTADLEFILGSLITDASAHISFMWTDTARQSKAWIKTYILNQ